MNRISRFRGPISRPVGGAATVSPRFHAALNNGLGNSYGGGSASCVASPLGLAPSGGESCSLLVSLPILVPYGMVVKQTTSASAIYAFPPQFPSARALLSRSPETTCDMFIGQLQIDLVSFSCRKSQIAQIASVFNQMGRKLFAAPDKDADKKGGVDPTAVSLDTKKRGTDATKGFSVNGHDVGSNNQQPHFSRGTSDLGAAWSASTGITSLYFDKPIYVRCQGLKQRDSMVSATATNASFQVGRGFSDSAVTIAGTNRQQGVGSHDNAPRKGSSFAEVLMMKFPTYPLSAGNHGGSHLPPSPLSSSLASSPGGNNNTSSSSSTAATTTMSSSLSSPNNKQDRPLGTNIATTMLPSSFAHDVFMGSGPQKVYFTSVDVLTSEDREKFWMIESFVEGFVEKLEASKLINARSVARTPDLFVVIRRFLSEPLPKPLQEYQQYTCDGIQLSELRLIFSKGTSQCPVLHVKSDPRFQDTEVSCRPIVCDYDGKPARLVFAKPTLPPVFQNPLAASDYTEAPSGSEEDS